LDTYCSCVKVGPYYQSSFQPHVGLTMINLRRNCCSMDRRLTKRPDRLLLAPHLLSKVGELLRLLQIVLAVWIVSGEEDVT